MEPYLRYCNTAWGGCGQLQNKVARVVSGISLDEANHNLQLKSLGWFNIRQLIYTIQQCLCSKYFMGLYQNVHRTYFRNVITFIHSTRAISSGNLYVPKMKTSKRQTSFSLLVPKCGMTSLFKSNKLSQMKTFKEKLKECLLTDDKYL